MRWLLILLSVLLCTPAMAENTVAQTITYSEAYGVSFRLEVDRVATGRAVYLFAPAVGLDVRSECIVQTELLLERADVRIAPEICVIDEARFSGIQIDGHRLYVNPMDWDSVEYAALLFQTAAGEYSHYGLAYGYASVLLGQGGAFVLPEDTVACDLNLLCFDEMFVSSADVQAAKQLSCAFAAEFIAAEGEDAYLRLLGESATAQGMNSVSAALCVYYARHGLDVQPASLRISYGGSAYQYRVRSEQAEFWIGREWRDANHALNPLVSENFLHDCYGEVRQFFQVNEKQMKQYCQLFCIEETDTSLQVLLPNPLRGLSNSCYQSSEHRILLLNVDSLMHEYIHALTRLVGTDSLWKTEGFARYFSYYYDMYGIAMLNEDYNHPADTAQARYVHEYLAQVGRPIDMAEDFGEIESIIAYTRDYQSPNVSYASGSAFMHYLVKRYGANSVIRHVMEDVPFDASLTRLTEDWKQWLQECYSGYTKYSQKPVVALPPGKSDK